MLKAFFRFLVVFSFCGSLLMGCSSSLQSSLPDWYDGRYPLMENKGQYPEEVLFSAKYEDRVSYLTKQGVTFDRHFKDDSVRHVVQMFYSDAFSAFEAVGDVQSTSSIFVGDQQVTGISGYAQVKAVDQASGIDLRVLPSSQDLGFVLQASDREALSSFSFRLEGCEQLFIEASGELLCVSGSYQRSFLPPQSEELSLSYKLQENVVSVILENEREVNASDLRFTVFTH